jgi:hypothetical protein
MPKLDRGGKTLRHDTPKKRTQRVQAQRSRALKIRSLVAKFGAIQRVFCSAKMARSRGNRNGRRTRTSGKTLSRTGVGGHSACFVILIDCDIPVRTQTTGKP